MSLWAELRDPIRKAILLEGRVERLIVVRFGLPVFAAYDDLEEEFAFLDEVLRARARAGLTQAEVAKRVGTTQSAIARLESGAGKHSPSVATLQRYARALGFRLQIKLVSARDSDPPSSNTRRD